MRAPLFALAFAACGHPSAQGPHGEGSFDDAILAGIPTTFDDACYSGPIWGAVDGDVGRQRLDAALAAALANAPTDARDSVCAESIAIARLRRAVRTRTLDLAAELGHVSSDMRAVAARYAGTATLDAAAAAKLRALLDDRDLRVRIAAYDAIAARHDHDAIPVLQRIAARNDDARPLACHALRSLGAPGDCEPESSDGFGYGMLTGEGAPVDYCADARANIASTDFRRQRDAMLFFVSEQFDAGNKQLVSLPEAHTADCLLAPGDRERLLTAHDHRVRALAAATTVWAR